MALTPAEKQRRYRARLKQAARAAPDQASVNLTGSFAEFLGAEGAQLELSFIGETFDSVGLQFPDLEKDADPEWRPEWGGENRGSLGRAERMVGALIDSARSLAALINEFKLGEIEAAISSLENRRKLDAKALKEAIRLNKIRDGLRKETRHSFPVTVVKGD